VAASYTDNIYGSFEQQLLSSGQSVVATTLTPESRLLNVSMSTNYLLMRKVGVYGSVFHTQEWIDGQSFGLTQFAVNANYGLSRYIKGLVVTAGITDSASQVGNSHVGLIANAIYTHNFRKWNVESNVAYDQDAETLDSFHTASEMTYNAHVSHNLPLGFKWRAGVGGGRTVFAQIAGNTGSSISVSNSLSWGRYAFSADYGKSNGQGISTAGGLVTSLPPALINPSDVVLYNGTTYGVGWSCSPTRKLSISGGWTKSSSDVSGAVVPSNNSTTIMHSLLYYRFRNIFFQAGYSNMRQDISSAGLGPTTSSSYYFGISRWLKLF
jgi:hypothetical protein